MANNGSYDAVSIAMQMGMDRVNAGMAVPQMWITPASSDPYSPVTIMMVQAIQRRLAKMGTVSRGDGFVDKATSAALAQLAGHNWNQLTWMQLFQRVLGGKAAKGMGAMGYTGMGYSALGTLEDSQWCSSKNPICPSPLKGIVKPMTVAAADLFKLVQSETNRVAQMTGSPKVAVDGRIGPGTLSAVNKAVKSGSVVGSFLPGYATVEDLARNADVVHVALSTIANSLNAPKVVAGPVAPHPSGSGGALNPPNSTIMADMPLFDRIKVHMSGTTGMVVIGATIIGGLLYYQSKKTGKKPKIVTQVQNLLK